MNHAEAAKRPVIITVISLYFLLVAAYLGTLAAILIVAPGKVSLMLGSRFMYGLELAGPYMMLLMGCGYGLIGWGLFRLGNWARWLAMLVFVLGVGSLVPAISAGQFDLRFFGRGAQLAIFAAAAFYLAQAPTALEAFARTPEQKTAPRILADPRD